MIYKIASSFDKDLKDDLFQVGVIGLINAYKNYNSNYDTKFSTYAHSYVLGEMKKYNRENKSIKISRDIMYLSYRLDRLIELLCQKYKRVPTSYELSREVGVEEWKIIEALNIKNCIRSLDEPLNSEGKEITIIDVIPGTIKEDNLEFNELLNILTPLEREIITLRYFKDKSQSEVSLITGYSQAKVSREEKRILCKLRSYYTNP